MGKFRHTTNKTGHYVFLSQMLYDFLTNQIGHAQKGKSADSVNKNKKRQKELQKSEALRKAGRSSQKEKRKINLKDFAARKSGFLIKE